VFLIDVERVVERMRFRVRLMGTALTEMIGRDVTGQYLDKTEMPPIALGRMRRLVETREPYHVVENLPTPNREFVVMERLALPLAADGVNVDMIFGACVVQPREKKAAE
jgi:hypothetical protein